MCHKYFFVGFLLATSFFLTGECTVGRNLEICPDYSKAVNISYDKVVSAYPNLFGIATLNVRVPEEGLLRQPISCILIIDQAQDGTGGDVTIMDGGVGSRSVDIHITSAIWRGLKYKIQVYTNRYL